MVHAMISTRQLHIQCPREDSLQCDQDLSIEEVSNIIGDNKDMQLKLKNFHAVLTVQKDDTLELCPQPDCFNIYKNLDPKTSVLCPDCNKFRCEVCQTAIHQAWSCDTNKQIEQLKNFETLSYLRQKGYIKCPHCSTQIELIEGCNFITCQGCETVLCATCHGLEVENYKCVRGCFDRQN